MNTLSGYSLSTVHDCKGDTMNSSHSLADTALTYGLVGYAMVAENGTTIMGILGFLLLVAKLVQEVPKAIKTIKGHKT